METSNPLKPIIIPDRVISYQAHDRVYLQGRGTGTVAGTYNNGKLWIVVVHYDNMLEHDKGPYIGHHDIHHPGLTYVCSYEKY